MTETNKSKLNFNLLSMHRSKLMGLAMLLVVFSHTTINLNNLTNCPIFEKVFHTVKDMGNCGVDIFLFLSGIGMYFSWNKSKDTMKFYKSRFYRIVPTYFSIIILLSLMLYKSGEIDFIIFILDVTATRIWFQKGYLSWYISAIIVLYLIVPIFMKHYEKYRNKALVVYLIGIGLLNLLCQIPALCSLRIFVSRIPIFIVGIKFGEMCFEKRKITKKDIIIGLISLIIGFIMLGLFYGILIHDKRFYSIEKYSYFFIIIPMSVIISYFFERFKEVCSYYYLEFIGGLTLEIYAIHERLLLQFLDDSVLFNMFDEYKITYNIIIFVLTIIISVTFNKVIELFRRIDFKKIEDYKVIRELVIK